MSLNKNVIIESTGAIAKCWDLVSMSFDIEKDVATITYVGWADHSAKESGKSPITSLTWEIPNASATPLGVSCKAFAKSSALVQPQLYGATEAPGQ